MGKIHMTRCINYFLFFVLAMIAASATPFMTNSAKAKSGKAAELSGSWRGSGTLNANTGETERVKCRATYRLRGRNTYDVSFRCVSRTHGAGDQNFTVRRSGRNRYSGRFTDDKNHVPVSVSVSVRGQQQSVSMQSTKGWGRFNLSK